MMSKRYSKSTFDTTFDTLPISKLVISLHNISKGCKNSKYSIAFGEIATFKPLH